MKTFPESARITNTSGRNESSSNEKLDATSWCYGQYINIMPSNEQPTPLILLLPEKSQSQYFLPIGSEYQQTAPLLSLSRHTTS